MAMRAKGGRPARSGLLPASWDEPGIPRTSSPAPPMHAAPIRHSQIRGRLLRAIEAEVPWLVWIQKTFRNRLLDVVMSHAGFLGSHVFFMLFLPLLFFGDLSNLPGMPDEVASRRILGERLCFFGRTLTVLLAAGVYFTGAAKDHFMLPRPPSPPVMRLSTHKMEPSQQRKPVASIDTTVHLEYGFPSTHSANALAISLASAIFVKTFLSDFLSAGTIGLIWAALLGQYVLVAASRVYCGMHAAIDVIGGSVIGLLIVLVWFGLGGVQRYEAFLDQDSWLVAASLPFIFGVLPVIVFPLQSSCPCFDDCVCFAFAFAGISLGSFISERAGIPDLPDADFEPSLGMSAGEVILYFLARTILGVGLIVLWRFAAKALGHQIFPRLLRRPLGAIRAKTSPEQLTRAIVYMGIGMIPSFIAPELFHSLGI